jgi:hypothetical protein
LKRELTYTNSPGIPGSPQTKLHPQLVECGIVLAAEQRAAADNDTPSSPISIVILDHATSLPVATRVDRPFISPIVYDRVSQPQSDQDDDEVGSNSDCQMDVDAYPKYKFSHTPTTGHPFMYEGYFSLGEKASFESRTQIFDPESSTWHPIPNGFVVPSRIRKLVSPSPNRMLRIQILMTTPRIQRTTCLRVMQVLDNRVHLSHLMRMEIC